MTELNIWENLLIKFEHVEDMISTSAIKEHFNLEIYFLLEQ